MEFLKKLFQKGAEQNPEQNTEDQEVVAVGTKIKVVAALAVVGFAGYIAYWIQEPVEVRTDVLGPNSSMQSDTQAAAQSQSETQSQTQATMQAMAESTTQQVSVANFAFDPATLNVSQGTTVVWTNNDTVPHNVVGDNFASPTLNPGDQFSYTFNDGGSFAYKCTFHPQMNGVVMVAAVAATQSQEQALGQTQSSSRTLENLLSEMGAQTQAVASSQEQLYLSSAEAPGGTENLLHGAAPQSISASLGNLGNIGVESGYGSTPGSNQQQSLGSAQTAGQETTVESQKKSKLAGSGPEDFVYAGIFGFVLFLNRKKLFRQRSSSN